MRQGEKGQQALQLVEEQRQGNNDLQKELSQLIHVASGCRLLLARQQLEGTSDYRSSVSGVSLNRLAY